MFVRKVLFIRNTCTTDQVKGRGGNMSISIFGFQALWSPYFLAALIVVTTLYYMFLAKQKDDVSRKQQVCFLTAVVLLYIVKGSPLDLLGHIMFSAHMTQMAIL